MFAVICISLRTPDNVNRLYIKDRHVFAALYITMSFDDRVSVDYFIVLVCMTSAITVNDTRHSCS